MRLWVQTRGRTWDYRFLGGGELDPWWRSYLELSSAEQRTLVVETGVVGTGEKWRAYLTGLETSRVDGASPTREIRTSLVLAGDGGDSVLLSKLVLGWASRELDGLVDGVLSDEAVEAWKSDFSPDETPEGLLHAVGQLSGEATVTGGTRAGFWFGGIGAQDWVGLIAGEASAAAATGRTGVFAVLNLLESPGDFFRLTKVVDSDLAVTILDDPAAPATIAPYEVPREVASPPANPPRAGGMDPQYLMVIAVLVVILLVAVCTTTTKKELPLEEEPGLAGTERTTTKEPAVKEEPGLAGTE